MIAKVKILQKSEQQMLKFAKNRKKHENFA